MDFSLFQLYYARKSQILPTTNLKVLKCEKYSWSEPSDENTNPAVALYKFGGGSRMAVTSKGVNEKKFFQLESGEETRTFPILIDLYPVSYTHLRAHETRGNLVCRLLLEKKNSSWNPERRPEIFQFLSTYTSASPNDGCGSSQRKILLFFGYCAPNLLPK